MVYLHGMFIEELETHAMIFLEIQMGIDFREHILGKIDSLKMNSNTLNLVLDNHWTFSKPGISSYIIKICKGRKEVYHNKCQAFDI